MDAATVLFITQRVAVNLARLVWWPIAKLIHVSVILLRPFYVIIAFALLPLMHLAQVFIRLLSLPFSVKWLEQIEVNYPFKGLYSVLMLNAARPCTSFSESPALLDASPASLSLPYSNSCHLHSALMPPLSPKSVPR